MQNLRYSCASVVLTLLITVPVISGEMGFPGPPSNPNEPPQNQPTANAPAYVDPFTAFAMSMLQSVLTLF